MSIPTFVNNILHVQLHFDELSAFRGLSERLRPILECISNRRYRMRTDIHMTGLH